MVHFLISTRPLLGLNQTYQFIAVFISSIHVALCLPRSDSEMGTLWIAWGGGSYSRQAPHHRPQLSPLETP